MHRIDGPGHAANMFTEGDPGTGVPRTIVTDDWANAVQEELIAVILSAALALDKPTNTQLRQALRRLFGGNVTTVVFADSPKTLTADNAGLVLLNAAGGNLVINLPAANVFGALRFLLVRTDATANTVTVNRAGADTIDNALTAVGLTGQGDSRFIFSNGASQWFTGAPKGSANGYAGLNAAQQLDMNAKKIIGLLAGAASGEAVHFGQFPLTGGTTGEVTLPNGLKLKWITYTGGVGSQLLVWPSAFNTLYAVLTGLHATSAVNLRLIAKNVTNVTYETRNSTGVLDTNDAVYILGIGT
jgi:hypothetical protein